MVGKEKGIVVIIAKEHDTQQHARNQNTREKVVADPPIGNAVSARRHLVITQT